MCSEFSSNDEASEDLEGGTARKSFKRLKVFLWVSEIILICDSSAR